MATPRPLPYSPEKLYQWRVLRGLTQVELSQKAGLHDEYVGQLERGKSGGRAKAWVAIASALGIEPIQLMTGESFEVQQSA